MGFDYKKEQKEYYSPSTRAHVIFVPQMRFVSVSGEGRADAQEGVYAASCALLRQVAVTLRDAVKAGRECAGFIDYVLPPAELMTWKEGRRAMWKRKDGRGGGHSTSCTHISHRSATGTIQVRHGLCMKSSFPRSGPCCAFRSLRTEPLLPDSSKSERMGATVFVEPEFPAGLAS